MSFFVIWRIPSYGCTLYDLLHSQRGSSFFLSTKQMKLSRSDNLINGQITDAMITNGWQAMVDLDASVNRLAGPLPSNLFAMSSLEVIDIHGNDFVGTIPAIGAVQESLFFVAVQYNSLSGNIPESISNLVNLKHLDVTANQLTLPFPSTMGQLVNMVSLYTGINGFTDHPVPDFLASMTSLRELSMKQNSLTGTIPPNIGLLTDLQVLDLDFNKLNGTIPEVSRKLATVFVRSYDIGLYKTSP